MADTSKMSGIRKVALLFVVLGDDATKNIFPHLKNEEIQEITREIAMLDRATTEVTMAIMEEFHTMALARKYVLQGGVGFTVHHVDVIAEQTLTLDVRVQVIVCALGVGHRL